MTLALPSKRPILLPSVLLFLTIAAFAGGPLWAGPAKPEKRAPEVLEVPRPDEQGAEAFPPAIDGGLDKSIYDRSLKRNFSDGLFSAVVVGRYLDEAPAKKVATHFRGMGLTSFVLKKQLEERRLLRNDPVGDFYVVMVGLFGRNRDAEILGSRLKAAKQVESFQVMPVDDPGEQESTLAQNSKLFARLAQTNTQATTRASKPLSANSPAATGEAFKNHVYGRYVSSFRDPMAARAEAEKLTLGGWPAAVKSEGNWHRVYMVTPKDHIEWQADSQTLKAAQSSAASQPGIFILVDMSNIQGDINSPQPDPGRINASACAGFSEAGRLGGSLRRTLVYIPDTSYLAALIPMGLQRERGVDTIKNLMRNWWDKKPPPARQPLFGPAIFNRPAMDQAIGRLQPDSREVSLAFGLTEIAGHLFNVPGRKIVLVFSEFQSSDDPSHIKEAISRLKKEFGSSVEIIFIYGDTDGPGYLLANDLAKSAGSRQAWDGCMLMNSNAYFEKYIKTIFR